MGGQCGYAFRLGDGHGGSGCRWGQEGWAAWSETGSRAGVWLQRQGSPRWVRPDQGGICPGLKAGLGEGMAGSRREGLSSFHGAAWRLAHSRCSLLSPLTELAHFLVLAVCCAADGLIRNKPGASYGKQSSRERLLPDTEARMRQRSSLFPRGLRSRKCSVPTARAAGSFLRSPNRRAPARSWGTALSTPGDIEVPGTCLSPVVC